MFYALTLVATTTSLVGRYLTKFFGCKFIKVYTLIVISGMLIADLYLHLCFRGYYTDDYFHNISMVRVIICILIDSI